MYQKQSFYRNKALGAEHRALPATTYNEMHLLFQHSGEECLFVPIRSMQYMSVIDHEEIIFVDSQRRNLIEFTWKRFTPQQRSSLNDPVPYTFEYYDSKALEAMYRMQAEFPKFIHQMSERQHAREKQKRDNDSRTVLQFPRG